MELQKLCQQPSYTRTSACSLSYPIRVHTRAYRWFQLCKLTCSWTPVCLLRAQQSQGKARQPHALFPSPPPSCCLSFFCCLARTAVLRDRVTMRVISTRRRSKFAVSCGAVVAVAVAFVAAAASVRVACFCCSCIAACAWYRGQAALK